MLGRTVASDTAMSRFPKELFSVGSLRVSAVTHCPLHTFLSRCSLGGLQPSQRSIE
jgi:hypothetical protein